MIKLAAFVTRCRDAVGPHGSLNVVGPFSGVGVGCGVICR